MLAMLHPAFHLDAQAGSAGCLRIVALLFEPVEDFGAPVTDASTDTEAGWAGPEVAPVAQRGHGDADHAGDLLHGEQLVVGVRGVGRFGRLGDAHVASPQRSAGSLTFRQWSFVLVETSSWSTWRILRRRDHRIRTSTGRHRGGTSGVRWCLRRSDHVPLKSFRTHLTSTVLDEPIVVGLCTPAHHEIER